MKWTIGDVTITKVVEMESVGGTRFLLPQATREEIDKLAWLMPDFATPDGKLKMTIHSLVIETPTRTILVDTGLGNHKQGRAFPVWNNRDFDFPGELAKAGYPIKSIDTVLCTHLHVDHVGWNTSLVDGRWMPTFRNARYIFGRTEYEHWRDHRGSEEHAAVFADSIKPIVDAGLADLVASDASVTEEVSLIPTPGHSPGHVSIRVRSRGQEALLTGDVAHHPCQMAYPEWSTTADSDQVRSATTRREVFGRFADTPVVLIGGHFTAGHLKRDGNAFRLVPLPA